MMAPTWITVVRWYSLFDDGIYMDNGGKSRATLQQVSHANLWHELSARAKGLLAAPQAGS